MITQFLINRDGAVSNIKVLKSIGFGCDEEAVRVLESMPNWKPGVLNDKDVNTLYTIPIAFKIQ